MFQASNGMNAAFASFVSELLGDRRFWLPYHQTEFAEVSTTLRWLNRTDGGHSGDRQTADGWAEELNLAGWYRWYVV